MRSFKLFKKADAVLLLFWGLCAAGLFLLSVYGVRDPVSGTKLTIICGNEIYGVYDLDKDQTIGINGSNTCEIKSGEARMTQADCPDKLCVHSRAISGVGESIVCLPNHVVLKITGDGEDSGIDAISE
ncbi:MAG: NusG domain II-containing protein [Lachnospiraceae bacterium]|nr:NusG domain II-containing protein [Lachnospiraceae bacterium]